MSEAETLFKAAQSAAAAGQMDRAADGCRAVLADEPNHLPALVLLGSLAARTGRHAIGIRALKRALELNPDEFEALIWLAILQHQLGEFEVAEGHLRRALELNPDSFAAYVGLLRGKKVTAGDLPLLEAACDALERHRQADDETRQMVYSVAKGFNDVGQFERAIRYYDEANQLARKLQMPAGFDRRLYTQRLNELLRTFSAEKLAALAASGNPTRTPIFILGMIRSGTTLCEQILSRHPDVEAGGEIRFWLDKGPTALSPATHSFNKELGGFLALEYLAQLKRVAPQAAHVTDKMPLNFMMTGLLHALFPNAPIIHCRRNPVDTCWSIYVTPYAAPPEFAYQREDIAYAYREYRRVMDQWRAVLPPGRMFEVDYEALVSNPEPTIRAIVAYCGLSWNPACLSPEDNERAVDTPSKWQVRQPVYTSSVGRARHYARWLGAIGALDDLPDLASGF